MIQLNLVSLDDFSQLYPQILLYQLFEFLTHIISLNTAQFMVLTFVHLLQIQVYQLIFSMLDLVDVKPFFFGKTCTKVVILGNCNFVEWQTHMVLKRITALAWRCSGASWHFLGCMTFYIIIPQFNYRLGQGLLGKIIVHILKTPTVYPYQTNYKNQLQNLITSYIYNNQKNPNPKKMHQKPHPQIPKQPPQQPQTPFKTTLTQIIQSLQTRNNLITNILTTNQQPQKSLNANSKYKIVTHCSQYSKIVPLVVNVISNSKESSPLVQHEKFWQFNQSLERQLQALLRELKNIDMVIDNIVNEEFDKCNQIDEIEETIRIILSKKDANHIAKAQPYYHQRQQNLQYLTEKKQEKQKVKQQKLKFVKKILALLDQLKKHRQSGLKMCLVQQKQRKNMQNEQILIQRVIDDFKQLSKNQTDLSTVGDQIRQLSIFISETQKHIDKYAKQLINLVEEQNQACTQLEEIVKAKSQADYFENSLLTMFGVQNLRKKSKKDYNTDLQAIIARLERFAKENKQKQKQVSKISQGIQTTKKTIGIFQHIMSKIQTENLRKRQLLKDIQKIQSKHSQQDKAISLISQTQNEAEKLALKKAQLNKNLQSKVNQANVAAYKSIHEQILKIQAQLKNKAKQLQIYKQNASQSARQLYDETMQLQENYEDILSEVVPSIWLKQSDFTKEESIKDLNLYLLKTFKRLSIAD